jgi:hypothetical protein
VNGKAVAPDASDILEVRSFFGLSEHVARAIVKEVAGAVADWRSVASATGMRQRTGPGRGGLQRPA